MTGSFNETTFFNGLVFNAEEQLGLIEKFGGLEGLGAIERGEGLAVVRVHLEGALEVVVRFSEALFLHVEHAEVVVGLSVVRVELDRTLAQARGAGWMA